MTIFNILSLIGGLAFFLYGINIMGDGLKKTSGGKLEGILGKITSNKVMAVFIGAIVTALMQSSSATTVMIVGFVNSGMMNLAQSVPLIMGANIGATITPWIMSLSTIDATEVTGTAIWLQLIKPESFAPILAIIGVFIILISKSEKRKNISLILIGFAVLMFGMNTMSDAVKPLQSSARFSEIMLMFSNPILGALVGTFLTAIIQSSSASIGMIQVLSASGLITYGSAIPLMIGANIGTCATALLSSIGTSRNARRTALIHFFYNVIRGALFLTIFYTLNYFFRFPLLGENANAIGIALFDTCLSIASAIVLFPFGKAFAKLSVRAIKITEEEEELQGIALKKNITLLDDRFLDTPDLAIALCKQVASDMADYTKDALFGAIDLLDEYKEKRARKVVELEDVVDYYEDVLGKYLVKLSARQLKENTSHELSVILHSIGDFERISDHAVNIVETAKEKDEKDLSFSKKANEEVAVFTEAIKDIINATVTSFKDNDLSLAANVEPMEEVIDNLQQSIKNRHIKRLRKGKCSIELGFVLSDLLTNYERVSDHCSNIAISILQKDEMMGAHAYENKITTKNNEEFKRLVKMYGEKYKLPKKSED